MWCAHNSYLLTYLSTNYGSFLYENEQSVEFAKNLANIIRI